MGEWSWIILGILFAIWSFFIIRRLKGQKQLFTRENFSKTLSTWGFLTLMIMAVVLLGVLLLR